MCGLRSFKKHQNSNQDYKTYLMMSSYFKTIIELKYFYE